MIAPPVWRSRLNSAAFGRSERRAHFTIASKHHRTCVSNLPTWHGLGRARARGNFYEPPLRRSRYPSRAFFATVRNEALDDECKFLSTSRARRLGYADGANLHPFAMNALISDSFHRADRANLSGTGTCPSLTNFQICRVLMPSRLATSCTVSSRSVTAFKIEFGVV